MNVLQKERLKLGFTHKQMACLVGIDEQSYRSLERRPRVIRSGKCNEMGLRIAQALAIEPHELWGIKTTEELVYLPESNDPDEVVFKNELRLAVRRVLSTLGRQEAEVLTRRFGIDAEDWQTLEEVGGALGVTRERVRQIEAKAHRKIRHPARAKKLVEFLDDFNVDSHLTRIKAMREEVAKLNFRESEDENSRHNAKMLQQYFDELKDREAEELRLQVQAQERELKKKQRRQEEERAAQIEADGLRAAQLRQRLADNFRSALARTTCAHTSSWSAVEVGGDANIYQCGQCKIRIYQTGEDFYTADELPF